MAYIPSGHKEAVAVSYRPLPDIVALLAQHALPTDLEIAARGQNANLNWDMLKFGQVYRVQTSMRANRHGELTAGDLVRFLGSYVFPYDNGLRLHFEPADGSAAHFCLEFEGNFPEADGVVRMFGKVNTPHYLAPAADPDTARAAVLETVASTLRHTADETRRLEDAAIEAATPDYERDVTSLIAVARLPSDVAFCFVVGRKDQASANLNYMSLLFGKPYRVTADVRGTRSGELKTDERGYFIGISRRYREEITLWFEMLDGQRRDVVFYPSDITVGAAVDALHNPSRYFEPLNRGSAARADELAFAYDALTGLRKKRKELP
ncbi:MAG: hypothetical protein ACSHWY_11625 [Octadecabacter sp.]